MRLRLSPWTARRAGDLLLWLLLAVVAAAVVFPIVWMVLTSFKPEPEVVAMPPRLWPHTWTLAAYRSIWQRIPFLRYLLNSVIFTGGVTLTSLTLDCMAGYAFARLPYKGRDALFVGVLIALMLPFHVTLVPLFGMLFKLGWLNTFAALIVPRATNAFGIFMMRQFFLTLPKELEEAARIDGAGEFRIFAQVYLPLAAPAVGTLLVFHFMYNWNDFLWPMIMTTTNDMRTLPVGLTLFVGKHVVEYAVVMAGATLTLLPVLVLFLALQKYFVKGLARSAMKG